MGASIWDYLQRISENLYQFALTLGGPGLFFVALADSSFLSVPEANDLLIVVLSTGQNWWTMTYYVMMTTVGSTVGCSLLYGVGRRGGEFAKKRLGQERVRRMEILYRRWGPWTILVPSVLPPPTPFKIFVLSAGLFRIPWQKFLVAIVVGRSIRYFMWGILAVIYGEVARRYLEQNLQTVGTVLCILLFSLIVIYVALKMRKKSSQQELA